MGEMKTDFFDLAKENPNAINFRAMRGARRNKFSYYFKLMFQSLGTDQASNMRSWLEAIASHFRINMDYVKPLMREEAIQLFQEFNLDPNDRRNHPVFQFWIYLNKVYISLLHQNYSGRDNIFGFMMGFPIQATKVVVIGQDPTRSFDSSGFAFHLSPCVSTGMLLKFVSDELNLLSLMSGGAVPQLFKDQWEKANENGDLNGWINQGVLLLNSCLTSKKANWNLLVNYLIRYLSRNIDNLVFILSGNMAMEKARFIDYRKHLVLRVYHPASYSYQKRKSRFQNGRDWDRVLPFINTNLFLLQKGHLDPACLIDWHQLVGKGDKKDRITKLHAFYLSVLNDPRTQSLDPGQKYVYDKRSALAMGKAGASKEEFEVRVGRGQKGTVYFSKVKIAKQA